MHDKQKGKHKNLKGAKKSKCKSVYWKEEKELPEDTGIKTVIKDMVEIYLMSVCMPWQLWPTPFKTVVQIKFILLDLFQGIPSQLKNK